MSSLTEAMDSTDSSSDDRVLLDPREVTGDVGVIVGAAELLIGGEVSVLVALFSLGFTFVSVFLVGLTVEEGDKDFLTGLV